MLQLNSPQAVPEEVLEIQREPQVCVPVGLVGTFKYYVQDNQVEWSDELFRIYGYEPGEIVPSIDLILKNTHQDDRQRLKEQIMHIPHGKDTFSWGYSIVTPAGEIRFVNIAGRFTESLRGKGPVIVGTAQDITTAKKAEEALQRANAELQQEVLFRKEAEQRAGKEIELNRSLTESSADGICAIDQEGICIIWNRALEDYTKIDRSQALGKKITDVLPGPVDARLTRKIANVLAGNRETLNEISFTAQGEVFDAILVPIKDSKGLLSGGLCVFHDTTDNVRHKEMAIALKMEQQKELLRAVLDAQEAERKRIAEGLHNGLGQLLYATKLKLENIAIPPQIPDQENIITAIKGVMKLMDEAIRETRIISHELIPTILEDFGLEVALEELCKKLSMPVLDFRLVSFSTRNRLEKSIKIAVYRIIQELLNNIIKHAQASLAEISIKQKGSILYVTVKDNGKGFRFTKANLTSGIGLSSIQSRLKLMNGEMRITSSRGTCIKITVAL